ncbi:hypothetical protein CsatB_020135 [Cannabis sativa]
MRQFPKFFTVSGFPGGGGDDRYASWALLGNSDVCESRVFEYCLISCHVFLR